MNKLRARFEIITSAFRNILSTPITQPLATSLHNQQVRGIPMLDSEKCLGCSLCARSCPPGAITMVPGGKKVIAGKEVQRNIPSFNYYQCIYCGLCADVCPGKAITMVKKQPVEIISLSLVAIPITDIEALKVLFAFISLLFLNFLIYWISGKIAPKGKHSSKAEEPFTGGVATKLPVYRYHIDELYIFIVLFTMLEVASFILILESSLSSTFFLSLLFLAYLLILTLNLLHRGVEK